ncbi:MAG: hypothetical protein KDJ71_11665, partial [Nitrobacter sp.]|nr:hypothetical protein [Nitrobacter sp.]
MARIRSIHPGLTSDEAYMSMSMPAKAGWTALWMHCDDHGIFEWKPIVLKALIFPADNIDFALLLDEWLALDCIKKVDIEGKPCGIVRNFAKYQRPKNPSYRYFKDNNLPPEIGSYTAVKGVTTPALPQPSGTTPEKSPQMEEEGGSRKGRKYNPPVVPPCGGTSPHGDALDPPQPRRRKPATLPMPDRASPEFTALRCHSACKI